MEGLIVAEENLNVQIEVNKEKKKAKKKIEKLTNTLKKEVNIINEQFKLSGYSKTLENRLSRIRSIVKGNKIPLRSGTILWNKMTQEKQRLQDEADLRQKEKIELKSSKKIQAEQEKINNDRIKFYPNPICIMKQYDNQNHHYYWKQKLCSTHSTTHK